MSASELLLADGLSFGKALERLSTALNGLAVEPIDARARTATRTLYDTFDGRLRSTGDCAVFEDGRFRLGALEVSVARAPERVLATELDPGPLHDALKPLVDVRALLPIAELEVRERRLRVLNDNGKTVARATVDEPAVLGPGRRRTQLAARVFLEAVRGYEPELGRVRQLLEQELGMTSASLPLVQEAAAAAGGAPAGVATKVDVPLAFEQPADLAAVAVLRALLDVIEANLEGTIDDLDSEFLHDLRVSVRRSRSMQRQLKGVFPPDQLARFRGEFRWLQGVTGPARDLDVYMLGFDSLRNMVGERLGEDLDPLKQVLADHRMRARKDMVRALRSKRCSSLRSDWSSFLQQLPSLPPDGREDSRRTIGDLAGERISKVYRQMVKMGRAIDADSPAEEYHELRKKGKELRYLLQLLGAKTYPDEVVKPMVKTLKGLQDLLGRHQDREVQLATLRELSEQVSARPGGSQALIAMGALLGALAEDERTIRSEFAERFSAFGSKRTRALVKETFG